MRCDCSFAFQSHYIECSVKWSGRLILSSSALPMVDWLRVILLNAWQLIHAEVVF